MHLELAVVSVVVQNALIHDVVCSGAHPSGAVDVGKTGIADASHRFVMIPKLFCGLGETIPVGFSVLLNCAAPVARLFKPKLLNKLTCASAAAAIWATQPLACVTCKAVKALARSRGPVTDTLAGALGVPMETTLLIRAIDPGDLFERTIRFDVSANGT